MRAYSIDLRKKVISFIKSGNSQKRATEVFDLNKATVNRWWLRDKREGHVNPRKNLGRKGVLDKGLLIKHIKDNPEFRLSDISLAFKVSKVSAYYHLKKLGYSYKKKPFPMWKRMKKSVQPTKKR